MVTLIKYLIKTYQIILSPILPFNQCRFFPTCSDYAKEALDKHGVLRGLSLGIGRIFKCHPYSKTWGYDPVPLEKNTKSTDRDS